MREFSKDMKRKKRKENTMYTKNDTQRTGPE